MATLAGALGPLGYEVELRHNGPDGLAEALASPYEAVILDVMMTGMDGFALCRVLRGISSTEHMPILLMMPDTPEHVERAFDAGRGSVRLASCVLLFCSSSPSPCSSRSDAVAAVMG